MNETELMPSEDWQTRARGSFEEEYEIYLACADDGQGNDKLGGGPLMTFEEWLQS